MKDELRLKDLIIVSDEFKILYRNLAKFHEIDVDEPIEVIATTGYHALTKGLSIPYKDIIKIITKEKNPEYFL